MPIFQPIPARQLNTSHVGKPMKLRLKNGKEIYGTLNKVRQNGIFFIPVSNQKGSTSRQPQTRVFPIFVPIFIPFVVFVPFLIF